MFHTSRLKNELKVLLVSPPNGIKVNIKENSHNILEAGISFISYYISEEKKMFLKVQNQYDFNDYVFFHRPFIY